MIVQAVARSSAVRQAVPGWFAGHTAGQLLFINKETSLELVRLTDEGTWITLAEQRVWCCVTAVATVPAVCASAWASDSATGVSSSTRDRDGVCAATAAGVVYGIVFDSNTHRLRRVWRAELPPPKVMSASLVLGSYLRVEPIHGRFAVAAALRDRLAVVSFQHTQTIRVFDFPRGTVVYQVAVLHALASDAAPQVCLLACLVHSAVLNRRQVLVLAYDVVSRSITMHSDALDGIHDGEDVFNVVSGAAALPLRMPSYIASVPSVPASLLIATDRELLLARWSEPEHRNGTLVIKTCYQDARPRGCVTAHAWVARHSLLALAYSDATLALVSVSAEPPLIRVVHRPIGFPAACLAACGQDSCMLVAPGQMADGAVLMVQSSVHGADISSVCVCSVSRISNRAPIRDLAVSLASHTPLLGAACGMGEHGTLRILRNGLAVDELARSDEPLALTTGVWHVRASGTSFLLLSFASGSRVLALEVGDDDTMQFADATDVLGIAATEQTLLAASLAAQYLVQVHSAGVVAASLYAPPLLWSAPPGCSIGAAAAGADGLLMFLSPGNQAAYLVLQEPTQQLCVAAQTTLPHQASCALLLTSQHALAAAPQLGLAFDPAVAPAGVALVGTYQPSVLVYALPSLVQLGELPRDQLVPSVPHTMALLPAPLGTTGVHFALGTRDGLLVYQHARALLSRRVGSAAVSLSLTEYPDKGDAAVLVLCDVPWLMSRPPASPVLSLTPLALPPLNHAASLSLPGFPGALAAVVDASLRILAVQRSQRFSEVHVALSATPRRVVHVPCVNAFAVACDAPTAPDAHGVAKISWVDPERLCVSNTLLQRGVWCTVITCSLVSAAGTLPGRPVVLYATTTSDDARNSSQLFLLDVPTDASVEAAAQCQAIYVMSHDQQMSAIHVYQKGQRDYLLCAYGSSLDILSLSCEAVDSSPMRRFRVDRLKCLHMRYPITALSSFGLRYAVSMLHEGVAMFSAPDLLDPDVIASNAADASLASDVVMLGEDTALSTDRDGWLTHLRVADAPPLGSRLRRSFTSASMAIQEVALRIRAGRVTHVASSLGAPAIVPTLLGSVFVVLLDVPEDVLAQMALLQRAVLASASLSPVLFDPPRLPAHCIDLDLCHPLLAAEYSDVAALVSATPGLLPADQLIQMLSEVSAAMC